MNERSIFAAALDIADAAERATFLDHVCGDNAVLRQHLDELLAGQEKLGSFLAQPLPLPQGTIDCEPITERPGTVIGPYKLMEQIGEGGMGLVFVAEQQQPMRRKVALKLIKPGMDTRDVIARFEAERQALALMDHPNIAKVLDAGATESGRPYFVMELVKGIPLTNYCDQNQLTPRERLGLFVSVCQAVQHAHTKGIIHRDLKPSNVLVTLFDGKPVPKVIDFGVAKAVGQHLTDKTIYTRFAQMIGTPLYMSPEQAEMSGLDIDTRSDIYSLGVLLYELLTGTTPFDKERLQKAAFDEIRRIIREEEPPMPSTRLTTLGGELTAVSAKRKLEFVKLSALVRGDLDWIVMKGLDKDRTRRYETASALAQDVERYLADEPVEACPPTAGYKLRKFARKNQKLLATAATFAALLLLGAAASAWQAVRATQAETVAVAERDEKERALHAEAEQRGDAQQQRDDAQRQRDEVRALNDRLQRTLYAAHMNLAQQAWEAGGIARVEELLEQHRPKPGETDLRGFEWYYLYRLCHAELLTITGGGGRVVYSPDGKRLASAGKVWDAQSGQELLTIKGASVSVAFSPDGKRLACPAGPQGLKVLDAQTGQELLTIWGDGEKGRSHFAVRSPVFSPDGKRLACVSSRGKVLVWDAQTGQELLSFNVDPGNVGTRTIGVNVSLALSPDGKRLALGSGSPPGTPSPGEVKVWDAHTGQEVLSLKGHTNNVNSVAFSPDGKRLASGSGYFSIPGEVKVWDAHTGQELLTFKGHTKAVDSVAFSPDGQRLATSGGGEVKVWNAQTGQELLAYKNGGADVVFRPDGQRLASSSRNTVKVWDAQAGQDLLPFKGHKGTINNAAFSPDGKRLASGAVSDIDGRGPRGASRNTVKVWDAQTGQELLTLKGASGFGFYNLIFGAVVAYSSDGKRLASGAAGGTVKVWDAQTGQELLTLPGERIDFLLSVAFSPDGKRLASASTEGMIEFGQTPKPKEVKVWDAQTGQVLLTLKGTNTFNSVAFSPDGKRLASGLGDPTVGRGQIGQAPPSLGEVKVWDAQTGQELLTLKGHTNGVLSVAFSPDGKCLASASADGTLKLWDAQTGQELLTLKGHINYVNRVAFSPDGKRLASAGGGASVDEGEVKVWDAQTGQELLTFKGTGGSRFGGEALSGVAFSPDGHRLVSGAADGTVKIWDASPLPEVGKK